MLQIAYLVNAINSILEYAINSVIQTTINSVVQIILQIVYFKIYYSINSLLPNIP